MYIYMYICIYMCIYMHIYVYAKQKHLGCKKRRGQSEAAII